MHSDAHPSCFRIQCLKYFALAVSRYCAINADSESYNNGWVLAKGCPRDISVGDAIEDCTLVNLWSVFEMGEFGHVECNFESQSLVCHNKEETEAKSRVSFLKNLTCKYSGPRRVWLYECWANLGDDDTLRLACATDSRRDDDGQSLNSVVST